MHFLLQRRCRERAPNTVCSLRPPCLVSSDTPTQNRAESDAPFTWTVGSLETRRVLVKAVIVCGQWVGDSLWLNVRVVEQRRVAHARIRLAGLAAVRVPLARTVP